MANVESLVSAEWLNDEMKKSDWKDKYILLDATWDLPMSKRDFITEHKTCRIPSARYFSLQECRNKEVSLPNTMPSPVQFENYVSSLNVTSDHHVILYDNSERFGLFSAARVWWLFQLFGHTKISILDGGLPRWKKLGYSTASGDYSEEENVPAAKSTFKANFQPQLVKDLAFMKENIKKDSPTQVMDARPNGRFIGVAPEPNPKIPSGHMPKAVNLPFFGCFDRENNVMLSQEAIEKYVKSSGVQLDKDVVATCGGGITACVLSFASFRITGKVVPVFDGSWFEWQLNTPNELQIREEKKE